MPNCNVELFECSVVTTVVIAPVKQSERDRVFVKFLSWAASVWVMSLGKNIITSGVTPLRAHH